MITLVLMNINDICRNNWIYNRWGELVYSWTSPNQNWDGRGIDGEELPEGVYYYVLMLLVKMDTLILKKVL